MIQNNKDENEEPEYGVYIGDRYIWVLAIFTGWGYFNFIMGFFAKKFRWKIILWASGITLLILFFWPLVGLIINYSISHKKKINYQDFLAEFKTPQILDCGCGTGKHAIQIAKEMPDGGGLLIGIDIFDPRAITGNSLERIQRNAKIEGVDGKTKFLESSITRIPFNDESFDIVTCMGVLFELHDENKRIKAFKEIFRVLKKDGIFFMTSIVRKNAIPFSGVFAFACRTKEYWKKQLKKHNFRVIKSYTRLKNVVILAKKMDNY
ncbi:MAG: class I SAM-dependent methyltransferase [Candidatus Helarchaeota archaeon]